MSQKLTKECLWRSCQKNNRGASHSRLSSCKNSSKSPKWYTRSPRQECVDAFVLEAVTDDEQPKLWQYPSLWLLAICLLQCSFKVRVPTIVAHAHYSWNPRCCWRKKTCLSPDHANFSNWSVAFQAAQQPRAGAPPLKDFGYTWNWWGIILMINEVPENSLNNKTIQGDNYQQ